jgi:class III poly(R)-hydroxyalkanoic acid synthase PhaE subunit
MEKSSSESTFESTQEFFDLWLKTYQAGLGRLVEMPAMGPAREKSEKMTKAFSTFVNLHQAWMESNTDLQMVFAEAMRRMRERTGEGCEGELSPEAYKDYYKTWIETYSETFHEFMKSDHYTRDTGRFLSHFIEFQSLNREIMEENYLKPMNLPTKAEIDEINKELYALRKNVKELRGQVQQLSKKS